jgi:nucleotide-binding universal stress UspA family protein
MKKILVPTDFSDNALKACLYAAEIARKTQTPLHLLHVIKPVDDRVRQPFPLHDKYIREEIALCKSELDLLKASIAKAYPDITIEVELEKGPIVDTIISSTRTQQVDIVIMGTQGAHGLKEVLLGSIAAGVLRHSKLPVLIIPDEYDMEEPDGILFATNHFEDDTELLNKLVEIARLFSAAIHVALYIPKENASAIEYLDDTRRIDQYINFLQEKYPDIVFKMTLLEGKTFEDAVEEYTAQNALDVVAMVAYPKNLWEKLFSRSTTRKMAFHSRFPLLAIPAGQPIAITT